MPLRSLYRLVSKFFDELDLGIDDASSRSWSREDVAIRAEQLEATTDLTANECIIIAGREHDLSTTEIGRLMGRCNSDVKWYESRMRKRYFNSQAAATNNVIEQLADTE